MPCRLQHDGDRRFCARATRYADALGENKLIFTDPQSGGVHLYAGIVEAGLPSMFAARLKVENRQITEIETSVLRRQADDPSMARFAVDRPIWSQPVPPDQRVSREALIDIADSYFEGITQARGDITSFDDACTRFENGGQMTLATEVTVSPVQGRVRRSGYFIPPFGSAALP